MWRRSVFFVLILLTACAASAPNRVVARKVEDYLGKWSGRWDNTFYVQFTVTQEPETKHVLVLYEWEEYPGQPLQRLRLTGHIENNILKIGTRFIELSVSPHDPDKGKAYGYFRTRRTAELTREKRVTRRTATDELRWSTFQGSPMRVFYPDQCSKQDTERASHFRGYFRPLNIACRGNGRDAAIRRNRRLLPNLPATSVLRRCLPSPRLGNDTSIPHNHFNSLCSTCYLLT